MTIFPWIEYFYWFATSSQDARRDSFHFFPFNQDHTVYEQYAISFATSSTERTKMIPWHLDWAFQTGLPVRTPGSWGSTVRRQLADLILPQLG